MSVTSKLLSENRVIVEGVSWETYESLLRDFDERAGPRIAFDQGVLEIVTISPGHEEPNWLLARIVELGLEEMDIDFTNLGHTTFKREALKRGFEPDCNLDRVKNKKRLDLETDPPPDLIIEVDVTSDSLNKLPIYAALRIPEVWRFHEDLEIMTLEQGQYVSRTRSAALPMMTVPLVRELMAASRAVKRPAWLREARQQIHSLIRP